MIKQWRKKEIKDAKDFGGKLTKGSGNYWSKPGDSKTKDFLIESKQTDKNSYSLNIFKWNKLSEESLFSFRLPLMSIKIKDTELVVLSKQDFIKLTKKS